MSRPRPTIRQLIRALYIVAKTSLRIAPGMSVLQITGSAISAGLPIATTYLAALTTTALAEAYAGDRAAGSRVVWLVAAAALSGVLMAAWGIFERYASELMRFRIKTAMSDVMYERFCAIEFWRYDDKDTIDMYERAKEFAQFFSIYFCAFSRCCNAYVYVYIYGLGAYCDQRVAGAGGCTRCSSEHDRTVPFIAA